MWEINCMAQFLIEDEVKWSAALLKEFQFVEWEIVREIARRRERETDGLKMGSLNEDEDEKEEIGSHSKNERNEEEEKTEEGIWFDYICVWNLFSFVLYKTAFECGVVNVEFIRTDLIAQFPYLRLHRHQHRFSYMHRINENKYCWIDRARERSREIESPINENGNQLREKNSTITSLLKLKYETCEEGRERDRERIREAYSKWDGEHKKIVKCTQRCNNANKFISNAID